MSFSCTGVAPELFPSDHCRVGVIFKAIVNHRGRVFFFLRKILRIRMRFSRSEHRSANVKRFLWKGEPAGKGHAARTKKGLIMRRSVRNARSDRHIHPPWGKPGFSQPPSPRQNMTHDSIDRISVVSWLFKIRFCFWRWRATLCTIREPAR